MHAKHGALNIVRSTVFCLSPLSVLFYSLALVAFAILDSYSMTPGM